MDIACDDCNKSCLDISIWIKWFFFSLLSLDVSRFFLKFTLKLEVSQTMPAG